MAVTVTTIATGTDTTAATVTSGAFTCSAGSILVAIGYAYNSVGFTFGITVGQGFSNGMYESVVSALTGDTHIINFFYKVASGSETTVTLATSASVDYISVAVLEITGLGSAVLRDMDSATGSASPIVHDAMDAGEVAVRTVLFCGNSNASQVDVPTSFTAIEPDDVGSHNAIRTSYRITTNPIGIFNDTFTTGRWATFGMVFGSPSSASGVAGIFLGADF